ncbi:hypothetical protein PCURB6_38110 [Paenibacillus curdlanolyticus]|nr:hypothetical protein PCURB6_38110 [Paenibacillus curdlanolyticus]
MIVHIRIKRIGLDNSNVNSENSFSIVYGRHHIRTIKVVHVTRIRCLDCPVDSADIKVNFEY